MGEYNLRLKVSLYANYDYDDVTDKPDYLNGKLDNWELYARKGQLAKQEVFISGGKDYIKYTFKNNRSIVGELKEISAHKWFEDIYDYTAINEDGEKFDVWDWD